MRRSAFALVAALLCGAPAASAAQRCALKGQQFIAKSPQAQLFSVAVKGKGAVKRRYFGCRTGHTPLLLTADITPKSRQDTTYANSTFRIGGTWAGWVETTSSDAGAGEFSRAIHVRSLAGARRAVDVFTNAGAGGYRSVDGFKVGSDGAVAFVLTTLDGAVEVDGVAPNATAPVALAVGRDIDRASLRLGAGTVTFAQGGRTRSFPLGAPPPVPTGRTTGGEGLDARFGDCGTLVPEAIKAGGAAAVRLARAPDGAIVVAGTAATGKGDPAVDDTVVVARFGADGRFDQGFGHGGAVATPAPRPPGGRQIAVTGLIVQADGHVVVSENASASDAGRTEPVLLRYDASGKLDPSFGTGGVVRTAVRATTSAAIEDLALAPGGGIVAAGQRDGRWFIARFGADGTLDPAFGKGGVVTDTGREASAAHAVVVTADGTIAIGGGVGGRTLFARFGAAGTPIGATPGQPPAEAAIRALALLPDGGFAAAGGAANIAGSDQLLLARYKADGAPDSGFGSGGFAIDRQVGSARDVAIDADGHWLVSAPFSFGGDGLVRYGATGARDGGFGYRGTLGGTSSAGMVDSDILLGSDGTALVAQRNGLAFAVSRFAVGAAALAATAGQRRVCAMLVAPQTPGALARAGKLGVGLRLRRPGKVHLHGTVTAGGRTVVLGDVTLFRPLDEAAVASLPVSRAAAALLRTVPRAKLTLTGGAPGGAVKRYTMTLG